MCVIIINSCSASRRKSLSCFPTNTLCSVPPLWPHSNSSIPPHHSPQVPATDGHLLLEGYNGAYWPSGFSPTMARYRHCNASIDTPSLCCIIVIISDFCNIQPFYGAGGPGIHSVWSPPCSAWWPYQEYKTPTDIDLGFIETCKR